jgi:DNA-binding MarR family transcriptional regulator
MSLAAERQQQRMLDALRRLVAVLRKSSHVIARRSGVSGAQVFVLQQLGQHEPMSINELARRTLTDQSSVSVVVARLLEAGMVKRRRAQSDGRRWEVSLTARGRRALARAPFPVQGRLIGVLGRCSPGDVRTAVSVLERLVRAVDASEGAAPMFFEDRRGD